MLSTDGDVKLPQRRFPSAVRQYVESQTYVRFVGLLPAPDDAHLSSESQDVADWVCAGLDILGLVWVGVFTSVWMSRKAVSLS